MTETNMTAKEYFSQARRLDNIIASDLAELSRLRELAKSVSSPCLEERHNPNRPTEAPFTKCVIRLAEAEATLNDEIDRFVLLKEQMRAVIYGLKDPNEQMVIRYRYVHNMTWQQVGDELGIDKSSAKRWHDVALRHVIMPADPIII